MSLHSGSWDLVTTGGVVEACVCVCVRHLRHAWLPYSDEGQCMPRPRLPDISTSSTSQRLVHCTRTHAFAASGSLLQCSIAHLGRQDELSGNLSPLILSQPGPQHAEVTADKKTVDHGSLMGVSFPRSTTFVAAMGNWLGSLHKAGQH